MATRAGIRKGGAVRRAWAWLTGRGYRPERHYMRGGRAAHAAVMTPQEPLYRLDG